MHGGEECLLCRVEGVPANWKPANWEPANWKPTEPVWVINFKEIVV